ncbi:MAG: glycosyl transferase, group 1 [Cyanobacteria bacterium RYN_339]|nr:glycosyl transferase, group 1 [Cyanobacteria bacterium RYN_339]
MRSAGSVLIIVENLPVPFDRRVWMEATTLQRAGYEVSVICPVGKGYEAEYEELDGVHIYRHPMPPEGNGALGYLREYAVAIRWELKLAKKVWDERGFDLVHICNPPDFLFLVAGYFKAFKGVKVIFDQHDINPELYEAKYGRRDIFYATLLAAERATFATADVVISTNESYREIALTRGKKADDQVFIVRSGPDLKRFKPTIANGAYRRGKRFLVGYLGVMGQQEGIDCLLRSIQHIVKTRTDIHFMLIGNGPAFDELQALVIELGIGDYVEFTGRVGDAELLERLSTCDVCVNPDPKTPFNDKSTMNKILEYMALGKPIVQFDILEGRRSAAAASLYATDEVDFAAKILELLGDPLRSALMGQEGRRRMSQALEWAHQAPKLLAAYARAFGHPVRTLPAEVVPVEAPQPAEVI